MGRKKPGKSKTKPWHKAYTHLNISQLLAGPIPKRLRAIDGAKTRLKKATTVKAAGVERRLIERSLKDIGDVYLRIKKALSDRGDLHRWNEFPGLEAAVNRVNGIDWSDLQGRGIPGGPVKYDIPTFDDVSFLSDSLEEGEIREDEIQIKKKVEDDPVMPLDVRPLQHPSEPESVPHNQPELLPHQNGSSCKAESAEYPPGYHIQAMPQSPITNHSHHPTNWDELAHHYYQLLSSHFYPAMPHYNTDFLPCGSDSSVRTGVNPQFPHGAGHSQVHALPQRVSGTTPPGIPTPGLTPAPHPPSLGLQKPSSNLPQEPSPATKPPSASPLRAAILEEHGSQHHHKRKFPTSTDSSTSGTIRPRKRRLPVASDFMSDDDEPEIIPRKHKLRANGVPDFGTWFQDQVTGSKKKLSHRNQASAATGDKGS